MKLFKKPPKEEKKALKKCKECLSEIDAKARKCRFCGSKQPRDYKNVAIGCLIFSVIGIFGGIVGSCEERTTSVNKQVKQQVSQLEIKETRYEQLTHKNKSANEFDFLILMEDKSEESMDALAREIRRKKCSRSDCDILFYDDRRAFELDMAQYDIMNPEELKKWDAENYIFIADHHIGYLSSLISEDFNYYPLKDWHYEELKKQ
jgi:hypothetical protein